MKVTGKISNAAPMRPPRLQNREIVFFNESFRVKALDDGKWFTLCQESKLE
jgi:hypothetical protein